MKLYELIFSPTGGTRYAASQLASAWEEGQVIDLCERGRDFSDCCFGPEDLCLAAVPVYGGWNCRKSSPPGALCAPRQWPPSRNIPSCSNSPPAARI